LSQIKADIPGQSADRINVAADGNILRIGVVSCCPNHPLHIKPGKPSSQCMQTSKHCCLRLNIQLDTEECQTRE